MATSYDDLPRDVTLKIVSKMDMDTKIKLGLIFKLKIPTQVIKKISNCLQTPTRFGDGNDDDWWYINLGPYVYPDNFEYTTYRLKRLRAFGSIVYLTSYTSLESEGTINFSTHEVEGEFDQ